MKPLQYKEVVQLKSFDRPLENIIKKIVKDKIKKYLTRELRKKLRQREKICKLEKLMQLVKINTN